MFVRTASTLDCTKFSHSNVDFNRELVLSSLNIHQTAENRGNDRVSLVQSRITRSNDLSNNLVDSFRGLSSGVVMVRGRVSVIESTNLVSLSLWHVIRSLFGPVRSSLNVLA